MIKLSDRTTLEVLASGQVVEHFWGNGSFLPSSSREWFKLPGSPNTEFSAWISPEIHAALMEEWAALSDKILD